MELLSCFSHLDRIPVRHTCQGDNVNPPLYIRDVPEAAVTLVLIMEDPDVPRHLRADGMWDHWLVWDMPADTQVIPEGTVPP